MYRLLLFISISVFMLNACSDTNEAKSSSQEDMSIKTDTLTLILDYLAGEDHIIQCTNKTLIYGVGRYEPKDEWRKGEFAENDIKWNSSYQKIERSLNSSQQKAVKAAISKLSTDTCFVDPNILKGDVQIELYVNSRRAVFGYYNDIDSFPKHIQDIIKVLLTMASPLYPDDAFPDDQQWPSYRSKRNVFP